MATATARRECIIPVGFEHETARDMAAEAVKSLGWRDLEHFNQDLRNEDGAPTRAKVTVTVETED